MNNAHEVEPPEGPCEVPFHRRVAWCARELWEKYGRPEGRDRELWQAAKRLLRRTEAVTGLGGRRARQH